MKRVLSQCLAMMALLALTVPASAAGAREAIQSTNAKFSALFAKGDAAALSALYAKDGAVMPAGGEPARGTQAIQTCAGLLLRRVFREALRDGDLVCQFWVGARQGEPLLSRRFSQDF